MKQAGRALLSSVLLGLCGSAAAQQTITFTNSTPAVTIDLLAGSTLGIGTNGNVSANCALDANNKCIGLPAGSTPLPNAPTASIAVTQNGGPITSPVNVNSSVTVTPTVTNAEICHRVGTDGAAGIWTGAMFPAFGAETVTLSAASTNYTFGLKCYGNGGSATATTVTVATGTGGNPPPTGTDDCPAGSPAAGLAGVPVGYTATSAPVSFPEMRTLIGTFCGNFPQTGSALCLFKAQRNQYSSLLFTAPLEASAYPNSKVIEWSMAQTGGEADTNSIYITLSECKGDFRIPTSSTAPANDPTLTHGCRNIKFINGGNVNGTAVVNNGLAYTIDGISTGSTCGLTPGKRYYLNFILADPRGGIQQGEHSCGNDVNQCGVQLRAQ